jgi:hypothetical protein
VTEPLLTCRLSNSKPSRFEIFTKEPESTLEFVRLHPDTHESGTAIIDDSSKFAWWNGNGIDEQLRKRLSALGDISVDSVVATLAVEITRLRRFQVSEQFDAHENAVLIPMFRWSQGVGEISGALIGFWLRPATELVRNGIDDDRLQTCRIIGIAAEDEVSGRGMRELVASLALLSITSAPFAATVARAGTESVGPPQEESIAKQQTSALHNLRGAKQRKVQALQQEPAKIYQDVLDRATVQYSCSGQHLQTARLSRGQGICAVDSPISSGRRGINTHGNFKVSEKDKNHISSIYHCPMKYFLRLSGMSFGLHVGQLPGYPASHGCVRLPEEIAKLLFDKATVGTSVTIET